MAAMAGGWHPVRVDQVVIAHATTGRLAHFPDLIALGPGRLLATYREGEGHLSRDGRIMIVASQDGGQTWSPPRIAVDGPFDDRDPKLTRLADGTVLLSYFVIDWTTRPRHTVVGTYVRRSADDDASWSEPVRVGSRLEGGEPTGEPTTEPAAEPTSGPTTEPAGELACEPVGEPGWAATHGSIVELPDGDLLAPLYGATMSGAWQRATAVRSRDGGRTWPAETEVTLGAVDGIHFQEPSLLVLPDGEVVALIRTTAGYAYLSRSFDGGRRWTAAAPTDLPASSHHLLPVTGGGVLVTYGDVSGRFAPRRHTVGRVVGRPHGDWDGWPDVPLYDSGHDDQANPSSAEVAPGRYLTLSFDVLRATVVGVFSTARDYPVPADRS
jgi:hypothetical protein